MVVQVFDVQVDAAGERKTIYLIIYFNKQYLAISNGEGS